MSTCNALIRTPEDRLYIRRCQVGAAGCLVLYITCFQASLHFGQTPLGFSLAAIASVGFFGELVAVGLLVMKRLDEFQRILMTQSFVCATVVTMLFATVYGVLELHGHGLIPHVDVLWMPVVLIVLTALTKVLIFRRHKSPAE